MLKIEDFKQKIEDAKTKIKKLEENLATARVDVAKTKKVKKKTPKDKDGLQTLLVEKTQELDVISAQVAEAGALINRVTALEASNVELKNVNSQISSQLLKVQ